MANHSSMLAWRIPWAEEPGGLQSMGFKESDTTEDEQPCIFKKMQWGSPEGGALTHISLTTAYR